MTAGRWRIALIVAGAAALLAPYGLERAREATPEPQETGPPAIVISHPAEGAVLAGNVAELILDVSGIPANTRFAVLADRSPPQAGAVVPIAHGIVFAERPVVAVGGLSPGAHRLTVLLVDATRARIGGLAAVRSVRTTGPSLTASAPATAVEGEPWNVSVATAGVAISAEGTHLHFFIDLDLPPPGVPISEDAENVVHTSVTRVPLTGLAAGEHRLWVVAGDAAHRPLTPYAADLVFVTVTR